MNNYLRDIFIILGWLIATFFLVYCGFYASMYFHEKRMKEELVKYQNQIRIQVITNH